MSTAGESYLFNQDREQERARVAGLSAQFDSITVRHLAAVGVARGWHCLEIGAGTGSIARWLADTVGSAGRVVATDLDTQFLGDLPRPPVEVVRHDITRDTVELDAFDLVHKRAVLEHVPSRGEVVMQLVKAVRPGGVLVLEDLVFGAALVPISGRILSPPTKTAAFARVSGHGGRVPRRRSGSPVRAGASRRARCGRPAKRRRRGDLPADTRWQRGVRVLHHGSAGPRPPPDHRRPYHAR